MTRSITAALVLTMVVSAEDWPQFRGPVGQGHSSETGLPLEWSESQQVAWKTPVPGRGWSSPASGGNRIWLTTATVAGRSLRAIAIDAKTGREVVDVEVFRLTGDIPIHAKNSHASPTPVVDGEYLYLHFGSHGTACIRSSGEIVWRTRLPYYHRHGPGGSPLLYRDLRIISCDGRSARKSNRPNALEKAAGTRWSAPERIAPSPMNR